MQYLLFYNAGNKSNIQHSPKPIQHIYEKKKIKSALWAVQGGTNQGADPKIGAENISKTRLYLIIKFLKVLNKIKAHDPSETKFRKNSFQGVKSKKDF